MTIDGVNSNSPLDQLGISNKTESKKELGQEDFLELLIAQIKNQDPLEPQTNGEFLTQLAQFSSADGIGKMQESLDNLSTALQSNQALQASALVGRKVFVQADSAQFNGSEAVKVGIDLPASANNMQAHIYSSAGELVNTINLGIHQQGFFEFSWDGKNKQGIEMPAGQYNIKVEGVSGGQGQSFGTMIAANVDSVSLGQGEVKLNVAGVGQVSLGEVKQITS